MSFTDRVFDDIPRQSVAGMEGMFTKMFDPPAESPPTPDLLAPTNPVPEVMAAAPPSIGGPFQNLPTTPHTVERRLRHSDDITVWDGQRLRFFMFSDPDNDATNGGTYPAATIRVPRGVIFHGHTQATGGPHTIHWHGMEPTPINDGVGHCSMELGDYTYQWQPNHIGTYFYHCHRNTVQHFEFGLWGALLIVPPDAYFATQRNPAIPIGAGRDGKFRTEANLTNFPQFPGFNSNPLDTPDPDPDTADPWPFTVDPHAMTVPYDVEVLWAFDDRDSVWAALATDHRQTYPVQGPNPGVDDNFHTHGVAGTSAAPGDFFAFNDFNSDYWFVTGVSVPGLKGGTGTIAPGIVIPPALNSGVTGTQVSINAQVGQTILIRAINGAYDVSQIRLPMDVLVIGADGRALGVPPFTHYSQPFVLPANTPIRLSVARRADAIFRPLFPFSGFAEVEFFNPRSEAPTSEANRRFTARIPINIA
ncbi:MAG: multicopper oxidase domain-containing protein, partial [Dehalococcoidales bacterium]|nr:multicopper oxidase domain-containing protein [Dehalococcoidales bacterium]